MPQVPRLQKVTSGSLSKLQKVASEQRFRVNSLRVKTIAQEVQNHISAKLRLPVIKSAMQKTVVPRINRINGEQSGNSSPQKMQWQVPLAGSVKVLQKDYEEELCESGLTAIQLRRLFDLRCEANESKPNEYKYQIFLKSMHHKLTHCQQMVLQSFHLGKTALIIFLEWLIKSRLSLLDVDMRYCCELKFEPEEAEQSCLLKMLVTRNRMVKVCLGNMGLSPPQLKIIFKVINEQRRLFSLDLSNINSQSMNRFGDETELLTKLLAQNHSLGVLKVSNLQLRKQGVQAICDGLLANKINVLRVLCLSNNFISEQSHTAIAAIARSGVTQLDLSDNPLNEQFYTNLSSLKGCTVRKLDLSATGMTSLALIELLTRFEQAKSVTSLRLNHNDFSHHWFKKIKDKLENNSTLQTLSMTHSNIRTLTPVFEGICFHKCLLRLNVSNNPTADEEEDRKKVMATFQLNKQLLEVRMRFCGLKEEMLCGIFKALQSNYRLQILDVSQNSMYENGAKSLLSLLQNNATLQMIGLEKLQISVRSRAQIDNKLRQNLSIREEMNLRQLKEENRQIRNRDTHSWNDLEQFEQYADNLKQCIDDLEQKVVRLETMQNTKKQQITALVNAKREEEKLLETKMKSKLRQQTDKVQTLEKDLKRCEQMENKKKQDLQEELKVIGQLQRKLKEQQERVRIRENELQDYYRDEKYKQSKKGPAKERTARASGQFDVTPSLVPDKRKSLKRELQ